MTARDVTRWVRRQMARLSPSGSSPMAPPASDQTSDRTSTEAAPGPPATATRTPDPAAPSTVEEHSGSANRGLLPATDGPNEPVWSASSSLPDVELPRLSSRVHADLCVIGLGGSGLTAVIEGLERGLTVVGLDAGPVAGRASGRNGGFLLAGTARFHHDAVRRLGRDRALAWYRATLAELDRITTLHPDVRRVGSIRLAVDDAEFADVERQFAAMRADDLPVEEWQDGDDRGLLIPTDAAANPLARCRRLAQTALDAGAHLFAHSPARTVSGRRVTTIDGIVDCNRVVVAVDGALGSVLPELAARVRPIRLQMLGTEPTDEVDLPRPIYARYGLDYWMQGEDGRLAVGGGRDHGADEEEGAHPSPSPAVQDHLDHLLRDRLGVTAAVTHRWAASVGYTASGLPICEQVRSGVWAVGGYSGTGNVVGSMLGRVAVELAHRGSSDLADELYAM